MFSMPGESYRGDPPPLTSEQARLASQLEADVTMLASEIGPRHVGAPEALTQARDFIAESFREAGYQVLIQSYEVEGIEVQNVAVELTGRERQDEILVVGAHYDSIPGCPAANDNGSGIAALLALARRFAGDPQTGTVRFVAFVNEEPPWFQTEHMGSLVYARACQERGENIVGMVALETMGAFSDESGSQRYPPPVSLFYPDTGNFIAFVGNVGSRGFVRRAIKAFRQQVHFPSEGAALPCFIQGIGWSDHWSFWQIDVPALMVTDTAPFRYRHYHQPSDTPDKLDYPRFARVVDGLVPVIVELSSD